LDKEGFFKKKIEGILGVWGEELFESDESKEKEEQKRTSAPFGAKRRLEIPLGYFLSESPFGTFGTKSTEILC
jgi:hypothetical protein